MPTISIFGGIKISMFYRDHNPPHFHAEYAGYRALIDIQNTYVIEGSLPNRQLNTDIRIFAHMASICPHKDR